MKFQTDNNGIICSHCGKLTGVIYEISGHDACWDCLQNLLMQDKREAWRAGARAMREIVAMDMSDELGEYIRTLPLPEMKP